MAIDKDALINAIESFDSSIPEVPGRIEYLPIPGVRALVSPLSHPIANIVSRTTLDSDEADEVIKAVYDFYADRKKAFGWVIGPLTTPADLGSRLNAVGIIKRGETAGMVLRDLRIPIESNPSVRIRKANDDDLGAVSKIMALAFPMPEDVSGLFSEVWMLHCNRLRADIHLAFLDGIDEPVGYSVMFHVPDQPIAMLSGAATLKAHRGKGIYTSLVARRLADARQEGAEAAAIIAMRTRSAPICRKLGFEEICGLEFYAWRPASAS